MIIFIKIGQNRPKSQYITLHFTEYFSEMEKMESFKVFKTFFLISKMDKNKCPIFILKKKFQKMKIVFFWHFFWPQKKWICYDERCYHFSSKWSWDHKLFFEKNAFFPIFSTFLWKPQKNLRTVLAPKKRASQLFSTFFLKSKHLWCGKK